MSPHYVLWFTGLSGSGKSTLAGGVAQVLKKKNFIVEIIEGDQFRKKMHPDLSFSPEEIKHNNKMIINHCLKNFKKNNFILVSVIAPFESTRSIARKKLAKHYIEIYCKASLAKCIQRDVKGLYKKALNGKIAFFIGVDKRVPYQVPKQPNVIVDTDKLNVKGNISLIMNYLRKKNIYE